MFKRTVKQACSSALAAKGLPAFFPHVIQGLYHTARYLIKAKNPRLCFYPPCPVKTPSNPDQQVMSVLQEQAVNANLAKSTYEI